MQKFAIAGQKCRLTYTKETLDIEVGVSKPVQNIDLTFALIHIAIVHKYPCGCLYFAKYVFNYLISLNMQIPQTEKF